MKTLRDAFVVLAREVFSHFSSPVAYVVLCAWLVWSGFTFTLFCEHYAQSFSVGGSDNPLTMFFGNTILFFLPTLALAPALTMRLLAEETRTGTLEALMTAPVSELSVVLGKYGAGLVYWVTLWVPTLLYVMLTSRYGDVDAGAVAASYLGVFGVGVYYVAVGLLASAIAPNQVIAFVLSFVTLGLLFALGIASFLLPEEVADVVAAFSVMGHMQDFSRGIVDSRYLVFDASVAATALFAAVRVLEGRRAS